ncbi:MAG: hypothetical protein OFPI_30910 [Osedax symbiont Rs2]|nr:MAG: hypothetical protein OFPI_30910 [Osedax symbiont Rs2]
MFVAAFFPQALEELISNPIYRANIKFTATLYISSATLVIGFRISVKNYRGKR